MQSNEELDAQDEELAQACQEKIAAADHHLTRPAQLAPPAEEATDAIDHGDGLCAWVYPPERRIGGVQWGRARAWEIFGREDAANVAGAAARRTPSGLECGGKGLGG